MKRLVFILLFIFTLAPIVLGQSRPSSVDHSAKFGPAITQYGNGCQVFSLAYLKSYIWNDKLGRNPMLPENQFSGYALWNQTINTLQHYAIAENAFEMMLNQGAVTADKFSQPDHMETLPSLEARENGLKYRSAELLRLFSNDYIGRVNVFLEQLQDSLKDGKCFILGFPIFNYINSLYNKTDAMYSCQQGISSDSLLASHAAVVVGYDNNKRAFKLLNSWGSNFGDNGYFFLSYDWFTNASWWNFSCYFLKEDFNHNPDLSLNLLVSNMVTGEDIIGRKNIFVDTVYSYWGMRFDYQFLDYFNYNRLIKIKKINNQAVPSSKLGDNTTVNKNNVVFLPNHNHDGNRQLLVDLNQYVKASDFKSLEILIQDPVSATYTGDNGNILYSYIREAKANVVESYVKFLGTNKRIVGKVTSLPDTTIIALDFDSYPVGFHQNPPIDPVHVAKCVSVIKRHLVTFRIEDISVYNAPPVYTNIPKDTLKAEAGSIIEYKFEAADPDGDQLRYSLAQPEVGATIDSATGLFKFHSDQPVKKQLKVVVTDGYNNVISEFAVEMFTTVGVEDEIGLPKEYSLGQNYPNPFNPATVINFSLPRSGFVTLKVYNLLGQEVAVLINGELNAGVHNTKFDAGQLRLASGIYIYSLHTREYTATKKMVLTKQAHYSHFVMQLPKTTPFVHTTGFFIWENVIQAPVLYKE